MKGSVAKIDTLLQSCAASFDTCSDGCLVSEILFLLLLTNVAALSFIASALSLTLSLVAVLYLAGFSHM